MTKLELLHEIRKQLVQESSAFRPGLLSLCQEMRHALTQHERCLQPSTAPRTTALGHKPQGCVVIGTHTHTDEAVAALDASD